MTERQREGNREMAKDQNTSCKQNIREKLTFKSEYSDLIGLV